MLRIDVVSDAVTASPALGASPIWTPPSTCAFVVSLMTSGSIEVRFLRGAPPVTLADASTATPSNLFAIFDLARQSGPCSY